MPDLADLYPGYASHWIDTSVGNIFARAGGSGPPLLLLHGYAQTNVMWHGVAPDARRALHPRHRRPARLRLVGRAARRKDHAPYTKRAMAAAMVEVMEALGHARFALAGHDRGGRVAYRLALDHPGRLEQLAMLDIVPTCAMWHDMDARLALSHLALDLPGAAGAVARDADRQATRSTSGTGRPRPAPRRRTSSAFDPRALAHYHAFFQDPTPHPCDLRGLPRRPHHRSRARRGRPRRGQEDRLPGAGAVGRDGHSERDQEPARHLARMGEATCAALPIDCGHYLPEENPQATAEALVDFFGRLLRRPR